MGVLDRVEEVIDFVGKTCKLSLEKKSNEPIIKSENKNVTSIKVCYFYPEEISKESKGVIKAIVSNGMDRNIKIENGSSLCYYFNTCGGVYKLAHVEPKIMLITHASNVLFTYVPHANDIVVVDGSCGKEFLQDFEKKYKNWAETPYLLFIKRGNLTSDFVNANFGIVEADEVVQAIADIVSEWDEAIEKNKTIYEKHKGKFVLGGLSLVTIVEELLRRVVLGGNETNEKTKNVKDLKKLIDLENADEFPNRKDGNSAPN